MSFVGVLRYSSSFQVIYKMCVFIFIRMVYERKIHILTHLHTKLRVVVVRGLELQRMLGKHVYYI